MNYYLYEINNISKRSYRNNNLIYNFYLKIKIEVFYIIIYLINIIYTIKNIL